MSSRSKEAIENEEAELRSLINAYAKLHPGRTSSSEPQDTQRSSKSKISGQLQTSNPTNSRKATEPDLDEVIKGSSISYTRREAQIYAKEEPCDSWRHFDELFHHQLPQHVGSDHYRYGHRRSPLPYWKELRFCLSTKTMPMLEQKIAVGRRKKEKLARLRQEGSSEDFWEIRKEPLKDPFPERSHTLEKVRDDTIM